MFHRNDIRGSDVTCVQDAGVETLVYRQERVAIPFRERSAYREQGGGPVPRPDLPGSLASTPPPHGVVHICRVRRRYRTTHHRRGTPAQATVAPAYWTAHLIAQRRNHARTSRQRKPHPRNQVVCRRSLAADTAVLSGSTAVRQRRRPHSACERTDPSRRRGRERSGHAAFGAVRGRPGRLRRRSRGVRSTPTAVRTWGSERAAKIRAYESALYLFPRGA